MKIQPHCLGARAAGRRHAIAAACALLGLSYSLASHATDVATKPVRGALLVEPNVVFIYDDSGSMDAEILLDTNEGSAWWNGDLISTGPPPSYIATAWRSAGNRPMDQGDGIDIYQFRKLFPQLNSNVQGYAGSETDPDLFRAAPPIAQLAWLRSSKFNRLYYDPMVTYQPWSPAILSRLDGTLYQSSPPYATTTYGNASVAATLTHPSLVLHPSPPESYSLFSVRPAASDADEAFAFFQGMEVPSGARPTNGSGFTGAPLTSASIQTSIGLKWYGVPYLPATYWHAEPCTLGPDCAVAPDGSGTLKRYQINDAAPSAGFPSGRPFAEERQNFANWWQYHRKRRLMTASVMGKLATGLGEGLRVGHLYMNTNVSGTAIGSLSSYPSLTLESTTGTNGDTARRILAGRFYNRTWIGGAPTRTRRAMEHVYNQFNTNPQLIQHACQRNFQVLITDGYASDTGPGAPVAGPGVPTYTTSLTTAQAVANLAYTTRLRSTGATALPPGKVPPGDPARPNPDLNTDLHINTYAISLGLKGTPVTGWPDADANRNSVPDVNEDSNPGNDYAWPTAPVNRVKIDDLWGAAYKGKGQMLEAQNGESLTQALGQVMFDITGVQGAQGAASFSSVVLSGNAFALLANYNAGRWNGDVTRRNIDPATGQIAAGTVWSAAQQLDALADPATRVLFTQGGPFDASTVGPSINPAGPPALTASKVDYLRGVRTNEGFGSIQFRPRLSRMGAVVSSVPATNEARSVAFVAANDGFLHAIDTANGNELWGYAPTDVLAPLGQTTQLNWSYRALHDGSPTVARVAGNEMLFGGLGTGGRSWYALDVSNASASLSAAQRANTVKWELPGTDPTLAAHMGLAVAKPILAKKSDGTQVLLLTSGYNAPAADGRGRLFVRNPVTGAEIATIATHVVAAGIDPGLAHVTAFRETDGTVRYVYGGDEQGNLWRFDLNDNSVLKVATLKDAAGNQQALTTRPALVQYQGKRIVIVGTGRLLGLGDLAQETRGNSLYAIFDNDTALTDPRATLVKQEVSVNGANGSRRITNPLPVDYVARRGWFIDLPADERANIAPLVGLSAVALVTNQPQADPCTMNSYQYALDIATGAAIPDTAHAGGLIGSALLNPHGSAGSSIVVSGSGGGGGLQVWHYIHGIDGSLTPTALESGSGVARKSGWRRIVK